MAPEGKDLIARMVQRDTEALAQFYDRYAPLAFSLILRIVRDRTDASEVLQDVFWEAWQSAAAYDPGARHPGGVGCHPRPDAGNRSGALAS